MRRIVGVLLCVVVPGFSTIQAGTAHAGALAAPAAREEVVAEIGKKSIPLLLPDTGRLLLLSREGGKWRLVVDGKNVFADGDAVSPVLESEGGRHPAFAVKRGDTTSLIVDGVDLGPVAYTRGRSSFAIEPLPMTLGPDGQSIAIIDHSGEARRPRVRVGFRGQPAGPEAEAVDLVTIGVGTPPRLAYAARKADHWSLVVDGVETAGPPPSLIKLAGIEGTPFKSLAFSPDGLRFAYWTWRSDPHFGGVAVIDGEPERGLDTGAPTRELVGSIVFSGDSKHVAHIVRELQGEIVAVVDGERRPVADFDRLLAGPVFSPDGTHLVYVAALKGDVFIAVDGTIAHSVTADSGDTIQGLTVSSAAEHVAFVTVRTGFTGQSRVVLNGNEVPQKGKAFPVSLRFVSSGSLVWYSVDQGKVIRTSLPQLLPPGQE